MRFYALLLLSDKNTQYGQVQCCGKQDPPGTEPISFVISLFGVHVMTTTFYNVDAHFMLCATFIYFVSFYSFLLCYAHL